MIYVLSFRDNQRNTGGPVLPGQLQRWRSPNRVRVGYQLHSELAAEPRVTFLIHGYNVSLADGRDRLLHLASLLAPRISGAIVATLWPGDTPLLGPFSYPLEGRDADLTAQNLTEFILHTVHPQIPISFVTHSLGARVAMETISDLINFGFPVEQVCLMAAAIDNDSLAHSAAYRAATQYADRVAVLHSKKDVILRCAYPTGDLFQAFLFFRDSPGFALGYKGPSPAPEHGGVVPPNVIEEAVGRWQVNHGDYLPPTSGGLNPLQQRATSYAGNVLAKASDPSF